MRLYEFTDNDKIVKCTPLFCKEQQKLDYNASRALNEFIEHKRISTEPWGKKDYRFTGDGPLKGLWHAHIIFGKVIAIYGVTMTEVVLLRLVDHSYVDSKSKKSVPLADYVTKLTNNDYSECFLENTAEASKSDLMELLYDVAVNDPEVLRPILNGDDADFMDFAIMTMDESLDRIVRENAVRKVFGGLEGLKHQVIITFKNLHISLT